MRRVAIARVLSTSSMTSTGTTARSSARDAFDNAVALHLAGKTDAAIAAYRATLAADPSLAAAMNNLGALLAPRGHIDDALSLFERAVSVDPTYAEAHNNLGVTLVGLGRFAEAIPHFEAALAHEPDRAAWWNNLGNARVECFQFAAALNAYDAAIARDPSAADAWSNRGLALRGLRQPDAAIASFERALVADPRFANALVNLGIVLKEEKRTDEAIAAFERSRELRPTDPALLCNYASVFEASGNYERMRELADLAAMLDDSFAEAYVLRGNYFMERGDFAAAESAYLHARSLDADNRNANWNLALIWLLQGDYRRGWAQFEWRKRLQSVLLDHHEYPGEAWTGDPLTRRSILLYCEQGLGDAIQFVRYARELKRRGAGRVIVEVPPALAGLITSVPGVDDVVIRGAALPPFDVHASLMDLPRLCGTELATIPNAAPYIDAPARPVSTLIAAPADVLKVGIVWAGNPKHQRDHLRSVPLSLLSPLFDEPKARFFSLQKGGPEAELPWVVGDRITDLSPHLVDFRDTAAAIAKLDLVVTVDTSVAHLAAALGRETWIMITHVPDFRWMLDRTDSPWYPAARLFRQPAPGDWSSLVATVRAALAERAALGAVSPATPDEMPMTVLGSSARRSDGRPRFELAISLADLADPNAFTAYERELLGRGDEAVLVRFFAEAMRDGDVLVDPVPGLGLAALNVLTSAAPGVVVHAVEPGVLRTRRLQQAAGAAGVSARLNVHTALPCAELLVPRDVRGRVMLRIGDAARTAEVLGGVAADGALDIAVVAWPTARPTEIAAALEVLSEHGFWLGALTLVDGEVTLDPVANRSALQTLVAIDPALLAELAGTACDDATDVGGRSHAGDHAPFTARSESRSATRWLAFDWEVRGDTGWGVYGLNLAMHLALRDDLRPVVLACNEATLSPLARHALGPTLASSAPASEALRDTRAAVMIDGTLLRAFGNGFVGAAHGSRLRANRDVGVIFFEDSHLPSEGLARASALDAIVAGSTWNAEMLRAYGLENVHAVIQGIDPAVFHPAPRTGVFGSRFTVFSGGKLEFRKGQDIVVAAFRRFRERYPDSLLITAWHNHWPQLISDLGLAGHVRGVPRVANGVLNVAEWLGANGIPPGSTLELGCVPNATMGQILREADVALFPNRCEGGTNLVAMECMAAGVPTIVSANTGHLDLIATGGCFALRSQRPVPQPTRYFTGVDGWGESDVDEIVALLERLYEDTTLRAERAAVGVRAMQPLTWRNQIDALLKAVM
jgi:tetratricopeptide (TPR) repeat protein/glycosyltransferase involved in cell wall biosynthesis